MGFTGAIYKDKNCLDCGVFMPHVSARRLRCPECAKKHELESKRTYMMVKRNATEGSPYRPQKNPKKKECDGCYYWFGEWENNQMCNYIFLRGKKRPCPPGKGCAVRVERRKK